MNKQICKICGIEKDYSEYHKGTHYALGIRKVCKDCRRIEKDEYTNRDYVILHRKGYYQRNKKEIRIRLNKHYHSLNGQYHNYKTCAVKRKIEFTLSQEDCMKFYNTKCIYCGDTIKGMGIDRVDSNAGYTIQNSVPCCSICNFMKHILTKDEFIIHIKKIHNHLKL